MKFISKIKEEKKKVKVSKNRKKSWRKHTDIKEIEDYLENQQFEQRVGFSATNATNEELFMIEKSGDDQAYDEKLQDFHNTQLGVNSSHFNLRQLSTNYRLYDKLKPTSNVPAMSSKNYLKERKKTIYNDDDKLEKFWNDRKDAIEQGRQVKKNRLNAYNDPKSQFVVYDLWDQPAQSESVVGQKPAKKVPVHLRQKPSLLEAVEVPPSGASYNPDLKQHEQLVLEIATKEQEKINEEERWTHEVEQHYVSKDEVPHENAWIMQMTQESSETDNEEEKAYENGQNDELSPCLIKPKKKKTKAQRRKELNAKLAQKAKQERKNLMKKENEVFRLKTIRKELAQREKNLAKRAEIRAAAHIASLYQPKKLSRYRFEEPLPAVALPSQLNGSLRKLKVEGNLFEDRFKSLQKRNIIETRVPQNNKRKYKLKKEVKRRHKETNNNK